MLRRRKLYKGRGLFGNRERHLPLITQKGIELGNFYGPGTQIIKRVKRGDKPKTEVDKISKAHDLRYSLARTPEDVRRADMKMINKLEESDGKDNPLNIRVAKVGMKLKTVGEDVGLMKKGSFAKMKTLSEEHKNLLSGELKKLEQEGYGLPGEAMLRSLVDKQDPVNLIVDKFVPRLLTKMKEAKLIKSRRVNKNKLKAAIVSNTEKGGEGIGAVLLPVATTAAGVLVPIIIDLIKDLLKKKQKGAGIAFMPRLFNLLLDNIQTFLANPDLITDPKFLLDVVKRISKEVTGNRRS